MEITEFLSYATLDFLKGLALGLVLGAIGGFFVLRFLTKSHRELAQLAIKDKEAFIKDREAIAKERETILKEKQELRERYEAELKRLEARHQKMEKYFKDALIGTGKV